MDSFVFIFAQILPKKSRRTNRWGGLV